MFCTNCGREIFENATFCTECGKSTSPEAGIKASQNPKLEEKWWFRLAKVIYIGLYIILPFLLIVVWGENCCGYYGYTEAFWLTLLTFIVYVVSAKLIKITFFYVSFAQKPQWKKEFKKLFFKK